MKKNLTQQSSPIDTVNVTITLTGETARLFSAMCRMAEQISGPPPEELAFYYMRSGMELELNKMIGHLEKQGIEFSRAAQGQ